MKFFMIALDLQVMQFSTFGGPRDISQNEVGVEQVAIII